MDRFMFCSATIGYGDVAGVSADERLFCIFAMITGGGVFAYGITNVNICRCYLCC